jgi:hemolysin activation/secretion protein
VRGFDYGTRRGQAFWSLQLDWALGRKLVRPVLFADAGQIGPASTLFGTEVFAGAGAGLSVFNGLVRFDLSHPITPAAGGLRFDLALRAVR